MRFGQIMCRSSLATDRSGRFFENPLLKDISVGDLPEHLRHYKTILPEKRFFSEIFDQAIQGVLTAYEENQANKEQMYWQVRHMIANFLLCDGTTNFKTVSEEMLQLYVDQKNPSRSEREKPSF